MVLVGAMLIFGERLNLYQWIGVLMAIISFFMLSRSGKKEGIDFKHDKWIFLLCCFAVMGLLVVCMGQIPDETSQSNVSTVVVQCVSGVYHVLSWHYFGGRSVKRPLLSVGTGRSS